MHTQTKERQEIAQRNSDFVPDIEPVIELKKEELDISPGELRERVSKLREKIDNNSIELCKYLWTIYRKGFFRDWGFQNFREYVDKEVTFKIGKAMSYVRIWDALQQNEDMAQKVLSVGWAKARELISVVTEENVEQWVDKAKHLNLEGVIKEVRAERNRLVPDDEKQALENAEEAEGTAMDITRKSVNLQFKIADYHTYCQALDKVKSEHAGLSNAEITALICADFIGSNNHDGRGAQWVLQFIKKYERPFGIKITVTDAKTGQVIEPE